MSAEQLLSSGNFGGNIVVADLEAGIGTLTRLEPGQVDFTVVVVEPTPRSIEVGARALAIAIENTQGRTLVVLNKVDDVAADTAFAKDRLGNVETIVVPTDSSVFDADRLGISLLDHAPDSSAAQALARLADLVVQL